MYSGFHSTGTVSFRGTVAPEMVCTPSPWFHDVELSNSGGIEAPVAWLVDGTFRVDDSVGFDAGSDHHISRFRRGQPRGEVVGCRMVRRLSGGMHMYRHDARPSTSARM